MHIITPYNPWAPKKKKTWQEELWEQNQIAEVEARMLAEASSKALPQNAPEISVATAGPMVNAMAGAGGAPRPSWFPQNQVVSSIDWTFAPSTSGPSPLSGRFVNLSSPDALQYYTWNWNFNDGTANSTELSPTHTFTQTGSYRVSLTGSNPTHGAVTQSYKLVAVSASRPDMPPTVDFTPLATTASVPFNVSFVNSTPLVSATTNTYKWIISGSTKPVTPVTTSAVANPTILFINTGSYSVKLELTGSWDVTGSRLVQFCVSAST